MIDQVLETIEACAQDPVVGLKVFTDALAALKGYSPGYVRSDFAWEPWANSGHLLAADRPNVAVIPLSWVGFQKSFPQTGLRHGRHGIRVAFETFDGDAERLSRSVVTVAGGLVQMLDRLEGYSDANGGTIALVELANESGQQGVLITFGDFAGPVTRTGFQADFIVQERSTR